MAAARDTPPNYSRDMSHDSDSASRFLFLLATTPRCSQARLYESTLLSEVAACLLMWAMGSR